MEFCTSNGRLQPGFRFYPTDEELVMYYLKRKVLGKRLEPAVVAEVDLYKFHPEDLRGIANLKKDRNWYFFCPRGKKYGCGDRTNRATTTGYWKATGNDRDVMYQQRSVGKIKTLVFHQGKPPKGDRTDWVMHEFKLDDKKLADVGVSQDSYVLCKIFKKSGLGPKNGEQYGAPFMEEEWDDDDEIPDCAQMVPADVQNQSISAVTDVMECTNACPSYTSEQVYSGSVSVSAVDQAPPPSTSNAAVANVVSSPSVLIPNYSHAIDHAHTPMPIASDWTSCSMTYSGAVSVSAVDQSPASTSNAAAKPASSSKGRILSTTAMPVCAYNAAANLASSSKCPIPYYNGAGVNQATAENVASSSKGPIPYYNATAVNQGTAAMPVHAYNSAVNQTSAAMPLHSYWASSSNIAFPNYYDPSVQMPTSAMPMIAAADIAPASTGPVRFYDDDEIFTAYDLGEVFGGLEDLDNRIVQGNESAWENFYEGGLALDDLDESL